MSLYSSINKYNKTFKHVKGVNTTAYYTFAKLDKKYNDNKSIYVIHIVFTESISVSKFPHLFKSVDFVVAQMQKKRKNLSKDNSRIYYILELEKKIRFWFDVRMSVSAFRMKSTIEKTKNIKLEAAFVLLSPEDTKTRQALETAARIFVPHYKPRIYNDIKDVEEFIENDIKNV